MKGSGAEFVAVFEGILLPLAPLENPALVVGYVERGVYARNGTFSVMPGPLLLPQG